MAEQSQNSKDLIPSSVASTTTPDFGCRGKKIVTFSNMLKSIHLGSKKQAQLTSVIIQRAGLQLAASKAKSLVARCLIKANYFPYYNVLEENGIQICIDLRTLIQVLTVFGEECLYHLEYHKVNDYLNVLLSNDPQQVVTDCQLITFQNEQIPDLRFNETPTINRLAARSPFFKNIFSEIDALGKDEEIVWFKVIKGKEDDILGLDHMNLSQENEEKKIIDDGNDKNDSKKQEKSSITIGVKSDTLEFEGTIPMNYDICTDYKFNESHIYYYRLSLLRPALRAIAKADLIRIFFNQQETIQIQHVFQDCDDHGWVQFTLLSIDTQFIDDDDD